MTPEERDALRARLAEAQERLDAARVGPAAPPPENPLAQHEAEMQFDHVAQRHGMVDPVSPGPGPHVIPDLYSEAEFRLATATFRGRMTLNSLLYRDDLCRGCKLGITDVLEQPFRGAFLN